MCKENLYAKTGPKLCPVSRSPVASSSRPTHSCVGQLAESTGSHSCSHSSHISPSWGRDSHGEVAVLALSLGDRALASRPALGPMGDNALAVTRHAFPLPVCGLVNPGWAPDCSWERRVHSHSRNDRSRSHRLRLHSLVVTRPGVTARDHTGPAISHLTVMVSWPHSFSWLLAVSEKELTTWTGSQGPRGSFASHDLSDSGIELVPTPAVGGGSSGLPTSYSQPSSGCFSACLGP